MRRPLCLTLLLTACGTSSPTSEGTPSCIVQRTEVLSDLSIQPDGFVDYAEDAVARAGGSFEGTLTFTDASNELIYLGLTPVGDVTVLRRSVAEDEGGGIEIDIDCDDVMVVPFELTLATDPVNDPWLNETAAIEVWVTPMGEQSTQFQLDFDRLVGKASPNTFDPGDMAAVTLNVAADRGTSGWSGSLDFQGETAPYDDEPDSPVSVIFDPWATFIATGE